MKWSQRTDPQAGEWKHEILGRGLLALAAAVLVYLFGRFVYMPYMVWVMPEVLGLDSGIIILYAFIGLVFGLAETVLRRTWRRAPLNVVLCMVTIVFSYAIPEYTTINSTINTWAPFIVVGGATGICAGLGARNLFATMLGFVGGQAGALSGIYILHNSNVSSRFINDDLYLFLLIVLLLVPAALLSGAGVWAGCRYSKTKPTATKPEMPKPPESGAV